MTTGRQTLVVFGILATAALASLSIVSLWRSCHDIGLWWTAGVVSRQSTKAGVYT